jgi:hypothetical protein
MRSVVTGGKVIVVTVVPVVYPVVVMLPFTDSINGHVSSRVMVTGG